MGKERIVIICPGRGSYTRETSGYLKTYGTPAKDQIFFMDEKRNTAGLPTLSKLDSQPFKAKIHMKGEHASPLIYACSLADFLSIDQSRYEIVAITGNSMGWYSALALGGALKHENAYTVIGTMGSMMKDIIIGGQIIYSITNDNWQVDKATKEKILKEVKKNNLFDNSRITLAGQSRGGDFVLEGVLNEDARNRAGLNHPIKTGVLFYPSGRICFGSFEIKPIQRPLIVLYGSEDPGLSICWKNLLPKLKHPNHPQVVKIYEGAHHAFDSDNFFGRCTEINVKGVKYDYCVRGDKGVFHQSVADLKAFLNIYAK